MNLTPRGNLIKGFLVVAFALALLSNYQAIQVFAQDKINQYFLHSVCDRPIHYKIGSVDPRFNLSKDQFLVDVKKAADIWDRVEDKNLFIYDPQGQDNLQISLVFDKRQQLSSQINQLESQVTQKDQVLKPKIEEYNQKKADFEKKITDLNNQIVDWNSKGGAPQDVFEKLTQEQNDLKAEAAELNQMAQDLNLSAQDYNTDVSKLNQTINNFDETLAKKPEEGLFDPNTNQISIYFNNNVNELIHTLAHELGHAVGVPHNSNQAALMYPYSTQMITPASEDIKGLNTICAQNYLDLFGLTVNLEDVKLMLFSWRKLI